MFRSILLSSLVFSSLYASSLHGGNFYIDTFCNRFEGKKNYTLSDGSRVGCYTASHVIEIKNAYNWTTALGQTLYNSLITKKKGGVVLIMEHPDRDRSHLNKLIKIAKQHRVYVWVIYANGNIQGIH